MTESEIRLAQLAQSIGRARRIAAGEDAREETEDYSSLVPDSGQPAMESGAGRTGDFLKSQTISHKGDCLVSLLASGSSGNAAFIRCGRTCVLIDAGISCRRIEKGLRRFGYALSDLDAVLITHEHTDHVSGLPVLLKRTHMPVYTTQETWQAIGNKILPFMDRFVRLPRRLSLGEMQIVPFATSHDAARSVGYSLYHGDCKITLATDLGCITPDVMTAASWSDILILESNHDETMLRNGPYPYALQQRILGNLGHLSNKTAAGFLSSLPRRGMIKVLLAHRSEHNNTPALTVQTMRDVLTSHGLVIGQDILLRLASATGSVRFLNGGTL
ncbi:MBL fold metallo-hydrolase [uncultured Megasphaera sp.]|jgi:phosphoribosyl 1,2-cyclic phosphodiesterase|uniref:MBL fold metallo-hydrolase n=1 Tax=uncultured Megasphaera sp. TaxID=165188 RepID=UPI0025E7BC8C|nr:MBL fold metallo-hydrolase [uncultured Megasphaera sp.]